METKNYRFSVEEVAAMLAVSGMNEAAKGLLASSFGVLKDDEERGRLLAANHSLYAQGILQVNDGHLALIPEASSLITAFSRAVRTIRVGKTGKVGEDILSFQYYEDAWMENTVREGIIYTFRSLRSLEQIETSITEFLSPVFIGWRKSEPLLLPETMMNELTPQNRRSYEMVLAFIKKTAAGHPFADALAKDISSASWRGSLLWLESKGDNSLSLRGTLLVQGPERLWMLNSTSVDGQPNIQACLCSLAQFRQHIHDFIRSNQAPVREI